MKEMCIDFRKNQRCPKPVYINTTTTTNNNSYIALYHVKIYKLAALYIKGEAVVLLTKYLGVVFDSKLNWKENINSVLI